MRAGLSTIQQTLTAEASAVLNRAIADAARRRHGQTTPLHVAASLLSSPSGHLRQACLRSHPNPSSSHPLQCRALELCFSVALDRLPSSSSCPSAASAADDPPPPPPPPPLPPLSNALMAALKRAQAHQRRGCPESQQQPLLAIKVDIDHLLLSILDDPSVSRVMREASFSSPAVKASIENSLSSSPSPSSSPSTARNLYLNPRLVGAAPAPAPAAAGTDLTKVFDILIRAKKRNPILVGDSDPGAVLREAIQKMATADAPPPFRSVAVISTEKEFFFSSLERAQIPSRIRELAIMVEARISGGAATGVVLDLGDLKWLVDGARQQQGVTDIGRKAVAEMGRLVIRFGSGDSGARVWLVGTASCATYLRCQVYFPTMESDWDLQAVPIAPRSPSLPGLFSRHESNGIASSRVEAFGMPRGFPATGISGMTPRRPPENLVAFSKNSLCNLCTESYERELAKLGERESEKSFSNNGQLEDGKSLPHWLQIAAMPSAKLQRQEQELMQKWKDTCSHLHRTSLLVAIKPPVNGFPAMALSPTNPIRPKLAFQSSSNNLGTVLNSPERPPSPPKSPVKTDLALGPLQKPPKEPAPTKFTGDATSIKRLVNGLLDKVSWQAEAASSVAAAIIQSKSGGGKRRDGSQKADTWLLFAGLDRVGKQKMAIALSELMLDAPPLIIQQGLASSVAREGVEESNMSFRGRTSIDRVVEALRLNPFSTIFFEDFDRTDLTVRGTIRRAMERGRLMDSHGREVSLGSTIFILTASWIPDELGTSNEELRRSEDRITELATSGRQLELQLEERTNKRRPDWLFKDERLTKPKKDSLSLDLNLSTGATVVDSGGNEDAAEGSWNSSDLTVENEQDHGHVNLVMERRVLLPVSSSGVSELIELVDAAVVFKPVDFRPLRSRVSASVSTKFTEIMGEGRSIAIDCDALDQMTGGVWLGGDAANLFDEWTDQVFAPAVKQLSGNPKVEDGAIVRLSSVKSAGQMQRSCLPASVKVAVGCR